MAKSDTTVFAHLALRFSTHPENIATEALNFILSKSATARRELETLANRLAPIAANELRFSTQHSSKDGSRPDLVGHSSTEQCLLVIEAKFWAGLTDAQPVDYLKKLPLSGGLLLFVAPEERIETLWPELARRVDEADLNREAVDHKNEFIKSCRIGSHTLALVSWRYLLNRLLVVVDSNNEVSVAGDLRQLNSLCDEMDSEAFLPLQSEEMTSSLGQRVTQFVALVQDLVTFLSKEKTVDTRGMRSAGANGYWGKYFFMRSAGCFLCFEARLWAKYGHSPIWIYVKSNQWHWSEENRAALDRANVFYEKLENACCVPIYLPLGVERETVFNSALEQLLKIEECLPAATVPATDPPPESLNS